MRVLVQRVKEASVEVNKEVIGKIDQGFLLFVGFTDEDNYQVIDKMVEKVINLRIFDDENGIMNKSILSNQNAKILSVSQFTLYADTKKGNRPSYVKALNGEEAIKLYDYFNDKLKEHIDVETGRFGADMKVSLINDGPITIMLEK